MKFSLVLTALLPVLATAASLGERDVKTLSTEFPEIDIDNFDGHLEDTSVEDEMDVEEKLMGAQAVCTPAYPRYCPKWNWCCRKTAVGCCRVSCCRKGTRYCGANGRCYG